MNGRFEYFLNVIHYFMFLHNIRISKTFDRFVERCFRFIEKLFLSKERQEEQIHRRQMGRRESNSVVYNKRQGLLVCDAHHWFGFFYSSFPCYFSFIFGAIYVHEYPNFNGLILILILAVPVALGYIPAYRAVFYKDRYLKYFRQFEKNDERWHRKWRRITTAFIVSAIIVDLLGIVSMFATWFWLDS